MTVNDGAPTEVDAVVVGAGFGGLYAVHKLRELGLSVQGFEAADGVGGTWYWNRYPGARCDVESVNYSYSFSPELEQEWVWSERYPAQPEILRYLEHVAERFDLRRSFRFDTRVQSVHYDEAASRWTVRTEDGVTWSSALCVLAVGNLTSHYLPDIEGIDSFEGRILHTARWPEDADVAGRRVGVIGTGSTGIQAIPQLARRAEKLTVFQRTANYSVPAQNGPLDEATLAEIKSTYSERRRLNRESRSGVHVNRGTRSALEVTPEERDTEYGTRWASGGGAYFLASYADLYFDLDANETAADYVRRRIRQTVKDAETARKLTPSTHPIGSKRICVDIDYFETYNRDDVDLVDLREDPIVEITPHGVRTASGEREIDVLVFATGFDAITGALFAIDIRGRDGRALKDRWAETPQTYLGVMSAGFPNLFFLTGPGSPGVLSNVVLSLEHHIEFVAGLLQDMKASGHSVVEPSAEAEEQWGDHIATLAEGTLYPRADSWYMGANIPGKPRRFSLYAGGVGPYQAEVAKVVENGYEGFRFTG